MKAENPTWGAGRIQRQLEQIGQMEGRVDAPKDRWVGNELRKLSGDPDWLQKEKEYRLFRWPESMESGLLPWEASRTLLDFINRNGRAGELGTERPTNRLAKWFWRIYQVAQPLGDGLDNSGNTELDRVESTARRIVAYENSGIVPEPVLRSLEGWLACHGWTEDGETHYYQSDYPYHL